MVRLVILGSSGSGKSTQARMLCSHFDIPLVSTDEVLREAIACSSDLDCHMQLDLKRGELAPDEMIIEFMRWCFAPLPSGASRLKKPDIEKGWILEGYPRTAFQAEELDFLLDRLGQKLDWAVYLQVSEAVMVTRSWGRSLPDDQMEIVHRRVELFYDRTIPILEYYDRRRRLLTIDGDQMPNIVQQNIISLVS